MSPMNHVRELMVLYAISSGCASDRQCITVDAPLATFAVFKDSAGVWQELSLTSGKGEMCVDQEYTVMAVCDAPTATPLSVSQHSGVRADGDVTVGHCSESSGEELQVTGLMSESGTVDIGNRFISNAGSLWRFDLGVSPGTHDLIATDELLNRDATRVAIRRAIVVDDNIEVPLVDLSIEGIELREVPLMISDVNPLLPDEETSNAVTLTTLHGFALIVLLDGTTTRVLTQSDLLDSDVQSVSIGASSSLTSRSVYVDSSALQDEFKLPPRLDEIVFGLDADLVGVSWSALPTDYEDAVFTAGTSDHLLVVTASHGWVEATSSTGLFLDTEAPGFEPRWNLRNDEVVFGNSLRLTSTTTSTSRFREPR